MVKAAYLFLYNGAQTAGWGFILYTLVLQFIQKQSLELDLWTHVGQVLSIFQYAAVLEVFHAAFNIVPSPLFTTFSQVTSRVALVFVASSFESARNSPFFTSMVFAWSLTEVIRYPFYMLPKNSTSIIASVLTWLRYTLFFVLYPLGVASELTLVYKAVEHTLINKLP